MNRERKKLVGARTKVINAQKAMFARLGTRGFKPNLKTAPKRLEGLLTPEGTPEQPCRNSTCHEVADFRQRAD